MSDPATKPPPYPDALPAMRAHFARLIGLAMQVAENAAAEALGQALPLTPCVDHAPATRPGEATARFYRAASVVRTLALAEIRFAHEQEQVQLRDNVPVADTRRAPLRENLRRCMDPALPRDAQVRILRNIDREVEAQLTTDPEGQVPIGELFCRAARTLSLRGDWKDMENAVLDFYGNAPWTPDPPPDPRAATHRLSYRNYPEKPPEWVPRDPWDQPGAPKLTTTIPLRDDPVET